MKLACRNKLQLLVVGALTVAAVFSLAHPHVVQFNERTRFIANCDSEGLRWIEMRVTQFAAEHEGRLPSRAELEEELKKASNRGQSELCCFRGPDDHQPYVWNEGIKRVDRNNPRLFVGCPRPHGYTRKWRNVLFGDLKRMRVS